MILSMTGYAAVSGELPSGGLNLELRAVNHRYLDLQFRIPDDFRVLETALRERLAARLVPRYRDGAVYMPATVHLVTGRS